MKYAYIITLLLCFTFGNSFSEELESSINANAQSDYQVISDTNQIKKVSIEKLRFIKKSHRDQHLFVVVFLGTDCPISQKYMHTLRKLNSGYGNEITFIGIIPHNFSKKQIRAFRKEYIIPFKLINDRHNRYAKEFKATVTPETFLFNGQGDIYYAGAIDDWFYALGKNKLKPTEHYLEDAINDVKNGRLIATPYVKAVGCFIEMKKG